MSEHGWTVTIETAAPDDGSAASEQVDALVDELVDHGGSVSAQATRPHGNTFVRYGATFSLHEPELEAGKATTLGIKTFRAAAERAGLPAWPIVQLELLTFAEHDAELERPTIPDLVGSSEVAEHLAVSKQRVGQLQTRHDFPPPVAILRAGPIWTRPSIEAFAETWTRKPGRPPREVVDAHQAERTAHKAYHRVSDRAQRGHVHAKELGAAQASAEAATARRKRVDHDHR